MKTGLKITALSAVLLMLATIIIGCDNKPCKCEDLLEVTKGTCIGYSFIDKLSKLLNSEQHSTDIFFLIKGEALYAIEHGRRVRLMKDLKGNFPENVDVFTVWGAGGFRFITTGRTDYLARDWNSNDTLFMLLLPYDKNETEMLINELSLRGQLECLPLLWFEKPGDFRTITCQHSVVRLSGNYVTGSYVRPLDDTGDYTKTQIMPLKEFESRLQELLNSKQ